MTRSCARVGGLPYQHHPPDGVDVWTADPDPVGSAGHLPSVNREHGPDLVGRIAAAETLHPAAQKVEKLDAHRLSTLRRQMEMRLPAERIRRGRRRAVAALDPNRGLDA